jgi:hypothetical protein
MFKEPKLQTKTRKMTVMKLLKILALASAISSSLLVGSMRADTNSTPPVVVNQDKDGIPAELKEIKALVTSFEAKRDAYVDAQKDLLAKLKNATTDQQRDAIREQLQDNRQAFLEEVRDLRQDIRHELLEIRHILHNEELQRLLDQLKQLEQSVHQHKT